MNLKTVGPDPATAAINQRMRELAQLSVLLTPELQIAPQERQKARHQAIAMNPAREALPMMSPMQKRNLEAARRKDVEAERDALRDKIVKELQETYLDGTNTQWMFPERSHHIELFKIQPVQPFLPVEVTEDGQGLTNFPRIQEKQHRNKRRYPGTQDVTEAKAVIHGAGPGHGSDLGPVSPLTGMTPSAERERRMQQQEDADMARRVKMWKKKQTRSKRNVPNSIFEKEFDDLRSGASSIETKSHIDKTQSLLPLSGINCAEATNLGAVAPCGEARKFIYSKKPEVLQEKLNNSARHELLAKTKESPRTEYERVCAETANVPRAPVLPVRGHYFKPSYINKRNREVITHDADVVEESSRFLPMPPSTLRRVQILESGQTMNSRFY